MDQQDSAASHGEHRTTTVEQGRFCFARCACGWRGPARRARSLARTDAQGHADGPTY
ncbi:hypothetical protein NGF19_26055 [Streptomyces sp. RY43-2]|uniref:Uncharacterized protein n=1 Tax=Streptomyces macrolidinus TaxID=2952607 RepID=A0ABT0ZKS9_9ACTN|nr:hypothetical protein [Streptomyces macrolidinus]MCN9244204.1 hypothetical protein [Streptomyces macrolidinus]